MKTYSVSEVAIQLDANEETVRRWIREGKLNAQRAVGRGGHSILLEDVVNFANQPPRAYLRSLEFWLTANKIRYIRLDQDQTVAVLSKSTGEIIKLSLGALLVPGVGTGALLGLVADEMRKATRRKKQYPTYCIRLLADDEELVKNDEETPLNDTFSGGYTKGVAHHEVDKEMNFVPHEAEMAALLKELPSEKEKDHVVSAEGAPSKQPDAVVIPSEDPAPEAEKPRNFLDEIAQAKQLLDMGILTAEEFAEIKARLIAKI